MRVLRIAELKYTPGLDSYIGELTRLSDLKIDRYSILAGAEEGWIHPKVAELLSTPVEHGGLDFPIATLEDGETSRQVYGFRNVTELMKNLSPSYCATRLIKKSDSDKMKRPKELKA